MKLQDLGRASRQTRGFVFALFIELGVPPHNKTMYPG